MLCSSQDTNNQYTWPQLARGEGVGVSCTPRIWMLIKEIQYFCQLTSGLLTFQKTCPHPPPLKNVQLCTTMIYIEKQLKAKEDQDKGGRIRHEVRHYSRLCRLQKTMGATNIISYQDFNFACDSLFGQSQPCLHLCSSVLAPTLICLVKPSTLSSSCLRTVYNGGFFKIQSLKLPWIARLNVFQTSDKECASDRSPH